MFQYKDANFYKNRKLPIDKINQMSHEELMRHYHDNYGKMGPVRQPVVEHWSVTELAKIMKPNQDQPPVMPVRQPIVHRASCIELQMKVR
jgi:hypothetical protein